MEFKLTFSGPRQPESYYTSVSDCIAANKGLSLARIAQALTDAGFKTPAGLLFDRMRVSAFLRRRSTSQSK